MDENKNLAESQALKELHALNLQKQTKGNISSFQEGYSYKNILQVAQTGKAGLRKAWEEATSAPIDFWGKVVDENGKPVVTAHVIFKISDNPDSYSPKQTFETLSDENGLFSLTGKKGGILFVSVGKEGYSLLKEPIQGNFLYFFKGKPGYNSLPVPENPALYVLRKKGKGAALARMNLRRNFPTSGKPVEIGFRPHQVDLKIEYRALSEKDEKKRFDWQCRISTPKGGLAPWKGWQEFDFEAPETGYKSLDEINLSKNAERWTDSATRKFFLKTTDGKYACLEFRVYVGNEPFFVIEAYYNPSGSRNLEYDPAKEINSQRVSEIGLEKAIEGVQLRAPYSGR